MPMLLDELKTIVGESAWSTNDAELQPWLTERRGAVQGRTAIMLSPDTTEKVSKIVAVCADAGVAVVPQGGNTGLCGGAIPDASGEQVLLSMSRLNRIRAVDADSFSMTVEAGCILQNAQQAALAEQRLLPLSLAAEGSCQIGGNLSTDAGGINVIRYGTARQQVLGLEVVLADGSVWDGLRALRKDTGGYDLKQLFIGSEGTLGIITAATLRLYPYYADPSVALVAIESASDAIRLLGRLRAACSDQLSAFELMSARAFRIGSEHIGSSPQPFAEPHAWYVLIESSGGQDEDILQRALTAEVESNSVRDVILAKNGSEADKLWRIRHSISDGQKAEGASIKHDISVPIGRIDEFMSRAEPAVLKQVPETRIVAFGHVGDGNLHYNLSQPVDADGDAFRAQAVAATRVIYDLVAELGGSFSAEHGVGVLKRPYLAEYRGGLELDIMRTLKQAMDPKNILNPGKVI
ncbi:MAG: FAD-binding oxidoreductase [Woeseiaceae bacterium]